MTLLSGTSQTYGSTYLDQAAPSPSQSPQPPHKTIGETAQQSTKKQGRNEEGIRDYLMGKFEKLSSQTARTGIGNMGRLFPNRVQERPPSSTILEQATSLDQVSMVAWSERRCKELGEIPGVGYLATQYGMKVAECLTPFWERKGPRQHNKRSAAYYHNVSVPGFKKDCRTLYKNSPAQDGDIPPSHVAFFHSTSAANRICGEWINTTKRPPKVISDGVVAVECINENYARFYYTQSMLHGPTPSIYEVMKKSHPNPVSTPTPDPSLDNCMSLKAILAWRHAGPLKDLLALPKEHPQKEITECAVALVAGLNTVLERQGSSDAFKHNPVIDNCLNKLAASLPYMVELAQQKDETQLFAAYHVMIEEISTMLISLKPYSQADFQIATKEKFRTRLGSALDKLHILDPQPYLFGNFTDGLTTVIDVIKKITGIDTFQYMSDHEPLPDYFETINAIGKGSQPDGTCEGLFLAILNPSTPRKKHALDTTNDWTVHKLIDEVNKRMEGMQGSDKSRLLLMLDATIEKGVNDSGASDLSTFCNAMAPHFNNKRLRVLTGKSPEKIEGVHSERFAAGEWMLIGCDDAMTREIAKELDEISKNVNWSANDESQFLIHAQTHTHTHALRLFDKVAKNAEFVHQHVLGVNKKPGFDWYEPGLPLCVITDEEEKQLAFLFCHDKNHGSITVQKASISELLLSEIDNALSFGHLETTFVDIDDEQHIRISVGHESPELLTEKLYALGWALPNRSHIRVDDMVREIEHLMKDALEPVLARTEVESWRDTALEILSERTARIDSELTYSLDKVKESLDDLENLHAMIGQFRHPPLIRYWNEQIPKKQSNLRDALIKALAHTRTEGEDTLSEDLKLLASASASVSHENIFAETPPKDSTSIAARYALNRAASMLALAGFVFSHAVDFPGQGEQSEDESIKPTGLDKQSKRKLDATFRAFLDTGLPRFTPLYRARVIERWLWLNQKRFEHPEQLTALTEDIIKYSQLLPWPGEKVKILANFPKEAFDCLQQDVRTRLIDTLFGALDFVSQCAFIKRLVKQEHDKKADACLNFLFEKIEAMSDEQFELLRQNLSDYSDDVPHASMSANVAERRAFIQEIMLNETVRFPIDKRHRLPADNIIVYGRHKSLLKAEEDGTDSSISESSSDESKDLSDY